MVTHPGKASFGRNKTHRTRRASHLGHRARTAKQQRETDLGVKRGAGVVQPRRCFENSLLIRPLDRRLDLVGEALHAVPDLRPFDRR